MNSKPDIKLNITPEIESSLKGGGAVLALESTIVAHGMPYPQNLDFAHKSLSLAKNVGADPSIVAVINGEVCIGLGEKQLEHICKDKGVLKLSASDLGWAVTKKLTGATTVSATITVARMAGINVFATGGIGGVHRNVNDSFDVSQDLSALATIPIIAVSSGAKAILDLPKTLEWLETAAVPILGYNTDEFPSFYSRSSGLPLDQTIESPEEAVRVFMNHVGMGLSSAVLVANPIPKEADIAAKDINVIIEDALVSALNKQIRGKNLTPFLLGQIAKKSGGRSLDANISLALNNVRLGAEIAVAFRNQKSS